MFRTHSLQIGGGVLGDLFTPETRGRAIAIYSLAPLLGPVIGPLTGAWIAERSTWRWVFWSTSIVDAAVQVAGMFFLKESMVYECSPCDNTTELILLAYAPVLLERRAVSMRNSSDIEKNVRIVTIYQKSEAREYAISSVFLSPSKLCF